MKDSLLDYDGTTFRIPSARIADLVRSGVIIGSSEADGRFELAEEHVIDEVEGVSSVVARRSGAEARGEGTDRASRLMLAVRFWHRDGQGGR